MHLESLPLAPHALSVIQYNQQSTLHAMCQLLYCHLVLKQVSSMNRCVHVGVSAAHRVDVAKQEVLVHALPVISPAAVGAQHKVAEDKVMLLQGLHVEGVIVVARLCDAHACQPCNIIAEA